MSKIKKNIYEKILIRILKVKKTDPPKTIQKNLSDWQSQVIFVIWRELWPFLKCSEYANKFSWKKWRTLMVPNLRLVGNGHPWQKKSSWETQRKIFWDFASEIFSFDWNIRVGKLGQFVPPPPPPPYQYSWII